MTYLQAKSGNESGQARSAARWFWAAGQARGERVLEIGTDQGDLALLLVAEGFEVTATVPEGLTHLEARRLLLPEPLRDRLRLSGATILEDVDPQPFDTVYLGASLANSGNPAHHLQRALTRLAPAGRLVVTLPFGPGPVRGWMPGDLVGLLEPYGRLSHLDVTSCEIRAVLERGEPTETGAKALTAPERLLRLTEDAALAALVAFGDRLDAAEAEAADLRDRLAAGTAAGTAAEAAAARALATATAARDAAEARAADLRDRLAAARLLPHDWLAALPVAPVEIARSWILLARSRLPGDPGSALDLLRAAHAIAPGPDTAQELGLALIAADEGTEALALLGEIADSLNLSSRARRLIERLRRTGDLAGPEPVRSRLRVATIMDEFTAACYAPECDLQQLSVAGWPGELERFRPEMLLIESAWRGLDEKWGPKVGQMAPELQGILDWCRSNGVPTAFWNKEDPVHFDTFLATAQQFDAVFTTDIDCVPRYRAGLAHNRVWFLPFACQPEIHNPLTIGPRKDAFCFAGAYYVRYPDRTRDLDDFLAHLTRSRPFEIFDRNYGKDDPNYMFPEEYRKYIVGTLPPAEIDRAYKGYTFGINLNSVKGSQSMFARRVYELLASDTRIVSNHAPGLRLMFGDLVVTTDSGTEALRRIAAQDAADQGPRIRLAGLRKVMAQHSYSQRLAYVADRLGIRPPGGDRLPHVTVLAQARTRDEVESLTAAFARQSLARSGGADMVVIIPDALADTAVPLPAHLRLMPESQAAGLHLGDLTAPGSRIAGLVAGDHYGAHYLQDLLLALRYSSADAIGKAAVLRLEGGAEGQAPRVTQGAGPVYAPAASLALRRSLIAADPVAEEPLLGWLTALPGAAITADQATLLAIDPFNYCEDGAADPGGIVAAAADDLPGLDLGLDLAEMTDVAEGMLPADESGDTAPAISGAEIARGMQDQTARVTWDCDGDDWLLAGHLEAGKHDYVYETGDRPLADLTGADGQLRLHLRSGPGYYMVMVVVFLDAARRKISHVALQPNRNNLLAPPEGTAHVRLGFRVLGTGLRRIEKLVLGDHRPPPRAILGRARTLLLTNHYPSYDDLYRNGFVHSRVLAYRAAGGPVPDLYRLRPDHEIAWHEFQDVSCMTGSAEQLDRMLESGRYDHVLVHFLDADMWEVLARHVDRVRITVWVHGAEVQPWWRRSYNYTTEAELEKAKAESDIRLAFWRGIFAPLSPNLHFVFVSRHLADEVFADLAVDCPPAQYQVIHNPIDDTLFAWHEKPVAQRGRILSIRPFASATYANDLTVKAILALRDEPFFSDLSFRIIGDGPLFEEVTAPLADLSNVVCEKAFLTRTQIAALHRDYGVFLCPSRMDSQGVSRDEAMSSGLVPVTSRVAAIPEFVDEDCGYLAEAEDALGLAAAIADLWKNPETFRRKSRAAAERVRRQSGKDRIIAAEMAVIGGGA